MAPVYKCGATIKLSDVVCGRGRGHIDLHEWRSRGSRDMCAWAQWSESGSVYTSGIGNPPPLEHGFKHIFTTAPSTWGTTAEEGRAYFKAKYTNIGPSTYSFEWPSVKWGSDAASYRITYTSPIAKPEEKTKYALTVNISRKDIADFTGILIAMGLEYEAQPATTQERLWGYRTYLIQGKRLGLCHAVTEGQMPQHWNMSHKSYDFSTAEGICQVRKLMKKGLID